MSLILKALEISQGKPIQDSSGKTVSSDSELRSYSAGDVDSQGPLPFSGISRSQFQTLFRKSHLLSGLVASLIAVLLVGGIWIASNTIVKTWAIESRVQAHTLEASKRSGDSGLPVALDSNILEGIFWDSKDPLCLIEGRVFHVGDAWKGKQIISITETEVTMKDFFGGSFYLSHSS